MINKDHLSPTISNADEIGQPERNSIFHFFQTITINSIVIIIFAFNSIAKIQKILIEIMKKNYLKSICTISLTLLL